MAKFALMKLMGILNLNNDSFFAPSRTASSEVLERVWKMAADGAAIIDLGAVSTRPGAPDVSLEEEWSRLEPALQLLADPSERCGMAISIDTFRSEIVRRAYKVIGPFIVNDISAGEDDPDMLATVGELGLSYVAMHKRGNPRSMDGLCEYPDGVTRALVAYFEDFAAKAQEAGIADWILDPGLGFAKTPRQCWEILENLDGLCSLGRPVLIGAADKRFTGGDNDAAHTLAAKGGAAILRVHDVAGTAALMARLGITIE